MIIDICVYLYGAAEISIQSEHVNILYEKHELTAPDNIVDTGKQIEQLKCCHYQPNGIESSNINKGDGYE